MLDLNRTMFFKAKFDIASNDDDLLWHLILQIRGWMMAKSDRDGYEFPASLELWSSLKGGSGNLQSTDGNIKLYSCRHIGKEGMYAWACRLVEDTDPPADRAPRQWVTEIGFEGDSSSGGTLSIVLSYCDRQGFIGPLQDSPAMTVPWIVRYILEDPEIQCSVSGIDISKTLVRIDDANAPEWFERVIQRDREIPLVYAPLKQSSEDGIEPEQLSKILGPNAIVLYTDHPNDIQAFNNLLRLYDLQCAAGGIRVYATRPDIDNPSEKYRHRFIPYWVIEANGPDYVYDILRRALAQDINFWETMLRIEDIKRLNRESDHEKRIASIKDRFQDEALEEMLAAEKRAIIAEQERDAAQLESKDLSQKKHELEARCISLQDALTKKGDTSNQEQIIEAIVNLAQMPPTNQQIADLIVTIYPNLIDFTQKGWESIKECGTSPGVFYEALLDMCRKLHPLFLPSFQGDIAGKFNNCSHFIYARGEGAMTHKDKKLMMQRKDVYKGRDLDVEKHIKSSTGDPNSDGFLRIYFGWDDAENKLVISDCGGHKDNYTTKKRK